MRLLDLIIFHFILIFFNDELPIIDFIFILHYLTVILLKIYGWCLLFLFKSVNDVLRLSIKELQFEVLFLFDEETSVEDLLEIAIGGLHFQHETGTFEFVLVQHLV